MCVSCLPARLSCERCPRETGHNLVRSEVMAAGSAVTNALSVRLRGRPDFRGETRQANGQLRQLLKVAQKAGVVTEPEHNGADQLREAADKAKHEFRRHLSWLDRAVQDRSPSRGASAQRSSTEPAVAAGPPSRGRSSGPRDAELPSACVSTIHFAASWRHCAAKRAYGRQTSLRLPMTSSS